MRRAVGKPCSERGRIMSWRQRHVPRELRLPKPAEGRIIALLSSLPRTEPEIKISPLKADFEVDLVGFLDCVVPLAVGEEGFYAEYQARGDHEFEEATFLKVARRVKVHGVWCLEIYETGGADHKGRFGLCWDGPLYHHLRPGYVCSFDYVCSLGCSDPLPTHITRTGTVKVIDETAIEGPTEETYHFAGYARVSVGGIEHECMRLVFPYQCGEKPESRRLDDIYVSRAGRVVLVRRYRSHEEHVQWMAYVEEHKWGRSPDDEWGEDFPTGRTRLTYNGQTFYYWFDILTDLTLGRLITPEWKPPVKKRRGRRYCP